MRGLRGGSSVVEGCERDLHHAEDFIGVPNSHCPRGTLKSASKEQNRPVVRQTARTKLLVAEAQGQNKGKTDWIKGALIFNTLRKKRSLVKRRSGPPKILAIKDKPVSNAVRSSKTISCDVGPCRREGAKSLVKPFRGVGKSKLNHGIKAKNIGRAEERKWVFGEKCSCMRSRNVLQARKRRRADR